jgi:hypothetical protein
MARRKGKSTRGKSRVLRAPERDIDQPFWDTTEALDLMRFDAGGRCPLCVALGVELEPSGHARATVQASVSPVPPATG